MKKIMLIYPPGELYQRGEDRCQININASVSNSMRACNDLGVIASLIKNDFFVYLKDYQNEHLSNKDLFNDVEKENPDILFISTTNAGIFDDLKIVQEIKAIKNDIIIILKGALFFNPDESLFKGIDLSCIDYLIGGEVEFIILPFLNAHFDNKSMLNEIEGICYRKDDKWQINKVTKFNDNLDDIPFPDRSLMNNSLYINPLTNKPMATISTSRGCPSSCIYCLSPVISGKEVRFRSSKNVFKELIECKEKYGITDFFFKSDTFTINKEWVIELCDLIIKSTLSGKINWCANSRANTIDEELIKKMKEAGCSLIAIGIESGSNDSLLKMKKGTTVQQNISAVKLIKKYGIKTFGFYLIGFPWENKNHLLETEKLIFELDTDFIELSIVTPFKNSPLYKIIYENQNDINIVLGKDSFKNITGGTDFLTKNQLIKFRKKVIFRYHIRPKYIIKKLADKSLNKKLLFNYIKYGIRLIKNLLNI